MQPPRRRGAETAAEKRREGAIACRVYPLSSILYPLLPSHPTSAPSASRRLPFHCSPGDRNAQPPRARKSLARQGPEEAHRVGRKGEDRGDVGFDETHQPV